jgi:hypothetical protein
MASCSIVQMMIQNIECIVRALHLLDTLGWMGHKHSLYLSCSPQADGLGSCHIYNLGTKTSFSLSSFKQNQR